MPSKDFDVAIVGGGMCGLACGLVLSRAGINVTIFEAAPKFDQVGAGVGLGPNALRALEELGLLDPILEKSKQAKPSQRLFYFLSGEGDHEKVFDYRESCAEEGHKGLGVYRPDFLDALMPLLEPSVTQFNKRCTSVEQSPSGRHTLRFSDGTLWHSDLVIGADGIKSIVRHNVVDKTNNRLGFSNTYAYRGLVPIDALKQAGVKSNIEVRPFCWVGRGRHIITFPLHDETLLNVVAFVNDGNGSELTSERSHPWVEGAPQQELLESYQGWGNDAMIILQHLKRPSRWSIHTLYPPLTSFINGRIVLIGDAAHGMLPHLGAGAGQGFEDVYVLYKLLCDARTEKSNLEDVLSIFNEIRPPRAAMVLQRSIKSGIVYESLGLPDYDLSGMAQHITGQWEPVWDHDLRGELARAIQEREEKGRN